MSRASFHIKPALPMNGMPNKIWIMDDFGKLFIVNKTKLEHFIGN